MLRGSCQGDIGKRPERKLPKSFAEGTTHWTSRHFKGVTCQHEDEHEADIHRWMKDSKTESFSSDFCSTKRLTAYDQCKICLHDSGGKQWVHLNVHITSLPEIDQLRKAMACKNIICAAKLATRALLRNVFLLPLFTFLHFASLRPYQNHFQCNLGLGP